MNRARQIRPFLAEGGRYLSAGRLAINAHWLLKLRWVAVVGQLATVAFASQVLHVRLPVAALLAIVGFTAATNVSFAIWLRRQFRTATAARFGASGPWLIMGLMILDLVSLAALLAFSGGLANPFVVFYFVNLTLGAVILPGRWAFALAGVAAACFTTLFLVAAPLPELDPEAGGLRMAGQTFQLGRAGLLAAMVTCASVVVYFITCVTRELRRRDAELRNLEQHQAQSQKMEALATLAAGAAHELSTPLSTIAVIAKELSLLLEKASVSSETRQDVALIRSEVDNCRTILNQMAGHSGQAVGGQVAPTRAACLIEEALAGLRRRNRVRPRIADDVVETLVLAPRDSLAQAVRGVIKNALDATDPDGVIDLTVDRDAGGLRLEVRDRGPGMPADVLARAGEPFFTTKPPGHGMGLGLFLTKSVVQRLGGSLELQSSPGEMTTAIIRLPVVS